MKGGYWVLDGHEPVHTDDLHAWARMFEDGTARTVAKTTVGYVYVSTVFLGADHNWGDGPPLLFETMTFDHADQPRDDFDERCWRYSTWDEAQAGHDAVVAALREGRELPQ